MTMTRDWYWYIEELEERRYTASSAQYHENHGRTVTVIKAGDSDD